MSLLALLSSPAEAPGSDLFFWLGGLCLAAYVLVLVLLYLAPVDRDDPEVLR